MRFQRRSRKKREAHRARASGRKRCVAAAQTKIWILCCERLQFVFQCLRRMTASNLCRRRLWVDSGPSGQINNLAPVPSFDLAGEPAGTRTVIQLADIRYWPILVVTYAYISTDPQLRLHRHRIIQQHYNSIGIKLPANCLRRLESLKNSHPPATLGN